MATTQKKSSQAPRQQVIKEQKVIVKERATEFVTVGGKQVHGFVDFIRTQGVVGLAVGILLGTAITVLTKSFIDNIVMPPLGLILGSGDGLRGLTWTIGNADNEPVVLMYGQFLNDFINFVVIALVVYVVFHSLGLTKLDKKKE
jgi:large conductance mechanosensitive channel